MRRHPPLVAWLLAPCALAAAQPSGEPADPSPVAGAAAADAVRAPAPAAAPLAVVDGVVRSVDLAAHRVTVDAGEAAVTLELDRNTLVYLPTGLSTVSELRPGEVVRAGRNGRNVAYWVQIRPAPAGGEAKPQPTPAPVNGPAPGLGK